MIEKRSTGHREFVQKSIVELLASATWEVHDIRPTVTGASKVIMHIVRRMEQ